MTIYDMTSEKALASVRNAGWIAEEEAVRVKWADIQDVVKQAEKIFEDAEAPGLILMWPFDKAPEALRDLACYNGGDEDCLVVVKGELPYLGFSAFDEADTYLLPNDFRILVLSHA